MVTEDKSVAITDGEETVTKVTRRGYSMLPIYKHALEPYKNYPVTLPNYQTHQEKETCSKQVERAI